MDYDPPSVYSAQMRRARKPRKCLECHRTIEPGEHYERAAGCYDGRWSTYHTCAHCVVARSWLVEVCRGFSHHAVEEELRDHRDDYGSMWMHRVLWRMDHQWTRPDGARYPVPRTPTARECMTIWQRAAEGGRGGVGA